MVYPSTQKFNEINYVQRIPTMIIGKKEPKKPIKQITSVGEDEFKREAFFKKIEFWIFSIVVAIVLGYAGIRLINTFLI